MEENSLKYDNLYKALNDFLNDFITTYKAILIMDNKKSSGNLINSISNYGIEIVDGEMKAQISIAEYWKYVEYGRRPGKFPPIDNIIKWVRMKPVIPRPMNGLKQPSEKQLAFLIARKISREGIEPGGQFEEALNTTWNKWRSKIESAISEDLQLAISNM